jgi:WD40 repeat protein/serine/threonine protein kinase
MSAPTTVPELLALIRGSGVLDPYRLEAFLADHPALPDSAQALTGALIQTGLLTMFQAERLLQGKSRGFVIGGYRILDRLGIGGSSQVFLAEHQKTGRRVAIKAMPLDAGEDPTVVERFRREARAAARLDHLNIVRAQDIGSVGRMHFIVMEFVDGTDLRTLVERSGQLSPTRAAQCGRQVAQALQYIHQAGLIHRGIKPSHLILDRSGLVKLTGLGLARFCRPPIDPSQRGARARGVLDYLAPEQVEDGVEVDIRTDIYGLGATLYFLLVGHPPFQPGSVTNKSTRAQMLKPEDIHQLRPEVPEGLATVVRRMMAKSSAQRYQTPHEVVAALTPWETERAPVTTDKNQRPLRNEARPQQRPPQVPALPNHEPPRGEARPKPRSVRSEPQPRSVRSEPQPNQRLPQNQPPAQAQPLRPVPAAPGINGILPPPAPERSVPRPTVEPPVPRPRADRARGLRYANNRPEAVRPVPMPLDNGRPAWAGTPRSRPPAPRRWGRFLSTLLGLGLVFGLAGGGAFWYVSGRPKGPGPRVAVEQPDPDRDPGLICTFTGHTSRVEAVAWSPDGSQLLSGSQGGELFLWDPKTFARLRRTTFPQLEGGVSSLAWSPDGRYVVTGGRQESVRLWNAEDKALKRVLPEEVASWNTGVAFSPDSRWVVSCCNPGAVRIQDIEIGDRVTTCGRPADLRRPWCSVAVSRDGKYVLAGGADGTLVSYDAKKGTEVRRFVGHQKAICRVACSPTRDYLASCGSDGQVILWDMGTGQEVRRFTGHTDCVEWVGFSPDGRFLLTTEGATGPAGKIGPDQGLRLWEVSSGKELHRFGGIPEKVHCAAFSPDGRMVAAGCGDKSVRLYHVGKITAPGR